MNFKASDKKPTFGVTVASGPHGERRRKRPSLEHRNQGSCHADEPSERPVTAGSTGGNRHAGRKVNNRPAAHDHRGPRDIFSVGDRTSGWVFAPGPGISTDA